MRLDRRSMADSPPKSPAGPSKQAPTALFEDMSKYFNKKYIVDCILQSFDKDQLIEAIDEAFGQHAFANSMFHDLEANLKGNIFFKQPAMKNLTECFHEQRLIDGICSSFETQHIYDGINDAFDQNEFADDIIRAAAATLTGDAFPNTITTEATVLRVIAINLTERVFSAQPTVEAPNIEASTTKTPTNETPTIETPTIDEKIKESVSAEVKAVMGDFQAKTSMDATALREQTLGRVPYQFFHTYQLTEYPANIGIVRDLFIDGFPRNLSAPKLITCTTHDRDPFPTAVVQVQLDTLASRGESILRVLIKVEDCESNYEALRKLYLFSQSVTRHACDLASRRPAKFYIMRELSSQVWGEGCYVGGSFP